MGGGNGDVGIVRESTAMVPRVAAMVVDARDEVIAFSKQLPSMFAMEPSSLQRRGVCSLFEGRDGEHFASAWRAATDGLNRRDRPFTFGFSRASTEGACNLKIEVTALEIDATRCKLVVLTDMGSHLNPAHQDRDRSYVAGRSDVAMAVLHHLNNVMTSLGVSAAEVRGRLAGLDPGRPAEELAEGLLRCRDEMAHLQEGLTRLENLSIHLRAELEVSAEHEMTDAASIVAEVIAALQPRARARGVRLHVAKCPNVGLVTDRHRLVQVLRQLVLNAIDASAAVRGRGDAETVEFSWSVDEQTGSVEFIVSDKGEGFEPAQASRLWDPGYSTWDRSGHGLHDAANLVSWLGGRMAAHSAGRGHGARFSVSLPLISA